MNKVSIILQNPPVSSPKEGQFFFNFETKGTYFLARVDHEKFCLVNLSDGQRWGVYPESSPIAAFSGKQNRFVLITTPFTITPDI